MLFTQHPFTQNTVLPRAHQLRPCSLVVALAVAFLGCDGKGGPDATSSASSNATPGATGQQGAAPAQAGQGAAAGYRCFGEAGFFRGADVNPKEDSVSYVEQRTGEGGAENRLVILSLATGQNTASDWFRRPCSNVVRFGEGLLALCSLTERAGGMSDGLYYLERGKLDAASIDNAKAIGTRAVYRFVGNGQVAYYQTNEKEIVRLTPDLKSVLVAKGTPLQLDDKQLLYVDNQGQWNSLMHDQGSGENTKAPAAGLWRDLPGGGALTKKDGAFLARNAAGAAVDASAVPKDLLFFAGNTALLTDGKSTHQVALKAGKLEVQPWLAVEGGQVFGIWSRGDKPHLVQVTRDTNLDGEVNGPDRSELCVLEQNATRLALPQRTAQEKELSAAVDAKLQSLGLTGAKWTLQNHGTLLAVVIPEAASLAAAALAPEALERAARQLHEAVEKLEPRLRAVLLRHEPQLRQGLSRRSASGRLLGYSGSYGALLPNVSDFGFSYEAVKEVVTGGSNVVPSAATCAFSARSLSKEPVQAQFDCQLLGPTIYFEKFEAGTLSHLDDAPVFSEVLNLGQQNQKVSLRAPAERNLRARSYLASARGAHLAKVSDGVDTRLVAVAKQWSALGASLEKLGARVVDPNYGYAEPFAHTRLLPRLAVDSSATDAQVKPLAKKLLKLLGSHYRSMGSQTTTLLLQRAEQKGRYDGNTDALSWQDE